jgi:hypothetical protein
MFDLDSYTVVCQFLPRLLGAIYFFAFGAFLFQIRGLVGQNGISPVATYLQWAKLKFSKKCYYIVPTIFWLNATDAALMAVVASGTLFSVLLMLGIMPTVMLILLFLLYLSIISVGQDFLSFGWEGFLQEVCLNAILISITQVPNLFVWISINLLLFRFFLQSGAVKLQSRDPNWNNLTAVSYHYESQPIPNVVAWYIHKMPMWFHKFSCVFMFIIELVVPFLIFFGKDARIAAFILLFSLQFFIWASGNFSYLNHLTVVLIAILLPNSIWGITLISKPAPPFALELFLSAAGIALILLQLMRLSDHFYPNAMFRKILTPLSAFHIVNRYGIFAVMTTTRYEVVVEGSDDDESWKEYHFFHKPTELNRRPHRISPYQPRIDWQAWFLPFQGYEDEAWFQNFLRHLLLGTPEILSLLRHNPFGATPPKSVRALLYIYTFTSFQEKRKTGLWWKRTLVGSYTPELSLIP